MDKKGRVLGVDFGDVRTGLACSDEFGFLAQGVGVISPGGIARTADAIAAEAKTRGVRAVVVGLPVNMDGSEGFRAQRARELAGLLAERLDVPISLFDERMSTMEAHKYLNETDVRGKKRKQVVDALSAQIILQDYLDRQKNLSGN